jgi:hypothetical protein
MSVTEPIKVTHLAKDDVSWETRCGLDLTGTDTPITQRPEHATCEKCVPPVTAPSVEPSYGPGVAELYLRFRRSPLEVYEDEVLDKAIYPGKGTGDSNALSYTLAGRINELGEYIEKLLPILEASRDKVILGEAPYPSGPAELQALESFIDICRMAVAVGKRAHAFKKPLRRGEIRLPPFVAIPPELMEKLDDEDGDTWWYQGAHTTERAGKRSWAGIIMRNIFKLMGRKRDGTIEGDGDKR